MREWRCDIPPRRLSGHGYVVHGHGTVRFGSTCLVFLEVCTGTRIRQASKSFFKRDDALLQVPSRWDEGRSRLLIDKPYLPCRTCRGFRWGLQGLRLWTLMDAASSVSTGYILITSGQADA